jgi:hypothetical protein
MIQGIVIARIGDHQPQLIHTGDTKVDSLAQIVARHAAAVIRLSAVEPDLEHHRAAASHLIIHADIGDQPARAICREVIAHIGRRMHTESFRIGNGVQRNNPAVAGRVLAVAAIFLHRPPAVRRCSRPAQVAQVRARADIARLHSRQPSRIRHRQIDAIPDICDHVVIRSGNGKHAAAHAGRRTHGGMNVGVVMKIDLPGECACRQRAIFRIRGGT